MTIRRKIEKRGVNELLHFTTQRGLVGCLACGAVISRKALHTEQLLEKILYPNSVTRPEAAEFFDKSQDWIDYVNLSISEINSRFFTVSERWHRDRDIWWVIMSFDSSIATHEGVYFATTNNKYDLCKRQSGQDGFDALFAPAIDRTSPTWRAYRGSRAENLATCEQAEVLYPQRVATAYLRYVYVRDEQDYDCVRGWLDEFGLPNVKVMLDAAKFAGQPN